jgi:Ni/Fe-hydrogenase subunit HybB-like protein
MDGAMGSYCVSIAEIVQGIGIFAIIGILYVLGLKFFALLPDEVRIKKE